MFITWLSIRLEGRRDCGRNSEGQFKVRRVPDLVAGRCAVSSHSAARGCTGFMQTITRIMT